MTFPNEQQRESAKRMIADHDSSNFYTFDQRVQLLSLSGNYMAGLCNKSDPMQVGDMLCELDNQRIPFEFRPEVSAKLIRNKSLLRDFNPSSIHKAIVGLVARQPTVDDNVRELILRIMEEGVEDTTRTGVNSRAVVGASHTYDISMGQVHAVSSKYTWVEGVKVELVWMISGDTNIRFLKEHKVNIWDSWVKKGTEEYRDLSFEVRKAMAKEKGILIGEDPQGGFTNAHLAMDAMDIPRQELIAGELPRIYQHQWRGWEQTRVVCREDADKLEQQGYEFRGMLLTPDDLSSGACNGSVAVVSRKIDQLQNVIDMLRTKPDDRGIILSAWNVGELDEMALRPCHTLCQFFSVPMSIRERLEWLGTFKPAGFEHLSLEAIQLAATHDDRRHETQMKHHPETLAFLDEAGVPTRKLSSLLYMRSNDIPLGHPFNIVQYQILTHMIAQCVGMATDTFTYVGGNCHVYEDQWPGVLEWLEHEGHPDSHPTIQLNPHVKNLFDFTLDDIKVVGYKATAKVKFPKAAV
jgi:thymidylate synthase